VHNFVYPSLAAISSFISVVIFLSLFDLSKETFCFWNCYYGMGLDHFRGTVFSCLMPSLVANLIVVWMDARFHLVFTVILGWLVIRNLVHLQDCSSNSFDTLNFQKSSHSLWIQGQTWKERFLIHDASEGRDIGTPTIGCWPPSSSRLVQTSVGWFVRPTC
jgi:hypothetical protein